MIKWNTIQEISCIGKSNTSRKSHKTGRFLSGLCPGEPPSISE
ncbi:hypothetical protein HMPREF1548_06592 [Clostridium sp. KLE 1755]|nr:hypothetical protein HMPREF1548_06592 [Clostridium sp. KLE 1755]